MREFRRHQQLMAGKVLRGLLVVESQRGQIARPRPIRRQMQHAVFDPATHHPAAEHKVDHLAFTVRRLDTQNARQSRRSEFVADRDRPHRACLCGAPLEHFRFTEAARAEIHLIRLVQQLRRSRDVRRADRLDQHRDAKVLQPFIDRSNAGARRVAFALCRVERRALRILTADRGCVEAAECLQPLGVQERTLRPLRHKHLRQRLTHASAFHRIVINENDRLQAEIELRRKVGDVLRLVGPVDTPSHEIACTKHHLRMLLYCVKRNAFRVLAHDPQHDAAT